VIVLRLTKVADGNPGPATYSSWKENLVFTWLRKRLAKRTAEKRFKELVAATEGSFIERASVAGLMMAIEAEEVTKQRAQLTPDNQLIFMMGYECCMMWAIKSGVENVLRPEQVQSVVLAMKRHLAKQTWHQAEAFEKIWAQTEVMMPKAMNMCYGPDAPPPYPVAEMILALNQAGYPLPMVELTDIKFGMHMLGMMLNLTRASRSAAQGPMQAK
jgi:hypothetical protein